MFVWRRSLVFALALTLAACGGHHEPSGNRAQAATARPATLSGRLTDRVTGVALAQATVVAQNAQNGTLYAKADTGADGSYTLTRLPLGVPIRVVSQPVTGAVVYGTEVSAPVTLVQGTPPAPVDLAFAQVQQTGRVEGARAPRAFPGRKVALVQSRDLGGGTTLKVVIRLVRAADDGSFQFNSVPPGDYEVHFLGGRPGHGRQRPPQPRPPQRRPHQPHHPRRVPGSPRFVAITVHAGAVAHVNWPASPRLKAEPGEPDQDEVEMEAEEPFELP
jgi:hypothetical protein